MLKFFSSFREDAGTSRLRGSCLWGVESVVVRKGLGTGRHSCQEGTKRPGEYRQHRVHFRASPAWCERDRETVLCLILGLGDGG